jgi:hypothetical protein
MVAQWEIALKLLREMTDATGMQGSWAVGQASIDKNMD